MESADARKISGLSRAAPIQLHELYRCYMKLGTRVRIPLQSSTFTSFMYQTGRFKGAAVLKQSRMV